MGPSPAEEPAAQRRQQERVDAEARQPPPESSAVNPGADVGRIIALTEEFLATIVRKGSEDAASAVADAERGHAERVAERRRRLAELREALIDRGSALARAFEQLLDEIEAAERELAGPRREDRAGSAAASPGGAAAGEEEASWRRRIWRRRLRRVA